MAAIEGVIALDAFNTLCGEKLGDGIHREVYVCRTATDLVVKVEKYLDYRSFANVTENTLWRDWEHAPKVAKWLAPCQYLSPDGRILLQRRAKPVRDDDQLPDKIPAFLTDVKRENFGWIDGQLVCIDYAYHITRLNMNMKAAKW